MIKKYHFFTDLRFTVRTVLLTYQGLNDQDAFLYKYAPIPKRRVSLSSYLALLLIQKLIRPNYGVLQGV